MHIAVGGAVDAAANKWAQPRMTVFCNLLLLLSLVLNKRGTTKGLSPSGFDMDRDRREGSAKPGVGSGAMPPMIIAFPGHYLVMQWYLGLPSPQ